MKGRGANGEIKDGKLVKRCSACNHPGEAGIPGFSQQTIEVTGELKDITMGHLAIRTTHGYRPRMKIHGRLPQQTNAWFEFEPHECGSGDDKRTEVHFEIHNLSPEMAKEIAKLIMRKR